MSVQGTTTGTRTAIPRPARWWPVLIIMLLATAVTVWTRFAYGRQRQDKNIATAEVVIITALLLLLWCLFFSRLRWKIRGAVFGVILVLVLLMPLLFRIHGVSGDLIPILEWRWSNKPLPSLVVNAPENPNTNAHALGSGDDYPQFLGPNRNSTLRTGHLARDWKSQPPQMLWSQPVGAAWSAFAIAGNRTITQEQRGEDEVVVCRDLTTGAPLWSYAYPAHYQSSLAGEGPRATPTIAGKRVLTLGATGILNCLDLETGKLIWSKDIVQDNHSHTNEWGISCSPLVIPVGTRSTASPATDEDSRTRWNSSLPQEIVVVSAGGSNERSLVAYDAATGQFVWGAGNDGAGYSSPLLMTLAGVKQILIFNSGGVSAHELSEGKILWNYHWPGGHPHVAMPVVLPEDRVLVSSGYGVGSELLQLKKDSEGKFSAERLWKSNRLKAKFTNVVYRDGYIYGLDDGIMVCLAASDGELKWKEGRYGHGQEILAGDLLLVGAETGEIILLAPNPEASRELARFSALKDKTWNPPALAGEYLVVRNDKEAACYRLPVARD